MNAYAERRGGAQTRVLLVVDVQSDVMAECVGSREVVSTIADLVARARASSVPVIWVQHSSDDLPLNSPGWRLVPQLVPAESDFVVHKTWGDSFAETDLAERLDALGAEQVVLCGAQTDACIRSTFYGGIHRGYDMTLVTDATGDFREFGLTYSPDEAIRVLNAQAGRTRQPDAMGAAVTAAEAFGG